MTPTFLDSVLRGAEALAARDAVGTLPDPDLLRRFAADRDPAAFAVLLRRHGPLVWAVCRNLLAADADAEDAFQATFLALVRSAGSVRRAEALGGWLHGVAYRVAMKARRAAARRRQRESAAAVNEQDSPVADAAWDELQAAVHAEVCRLPEKLRLPFVLCGLQGRQQADAARQLGWKVGTLSARLTQARQRLLDRLARRGVPVGVAAGAAVLGLASSTAAVPASVCMKTLSAARDPASASEIVLSLARGVSVMTVTRTKLLALAVLAASVLTTGIGARLMSTAEAQPPARETDADQVKRALEYLSKQRSRSEWEYKFIPMEKPLRITDLQAVLRTAELEGWEYCGSQDIATADEKPRLVPHLAFKRKRDERAADQTTAAAVAALMAAQAEKEANRAEAALQLRTREAALRNLREAETAKQLYEKRLRDAEAALHQERARAEEALARERARTVQLELKLRDDMTTNDAFLKKLRELEESRPAADLRAPAKNLVLPLRHVSAQSVLKVLDSLKESPFSAVADERTNSLILHGPPDVLAKVKEAIEKTLDAPPTAKAGTNRKEADNWRNFELTVFHLKHTSPKAAKDLLAKTFADGKLPYLADITGNALVVAGPAESLQAIRKVVETLDKPTSERPSK
jgi:RNA polymerase sigma factor (sigma-70 family)